MYCLDALFRAYKMLGRPVQCLEGGVCKNGYMYWYLIYLSEVLIRPVRFPFLIDLSED